jgi:pimeloyl-ACP methyl ester carboxylesterase
MEDATPISAPSRIGLLREATGLLEPARLAWSLPRLAGLPRGAGEPVMVLPGFGTSDRATWVLRRYLDYLGYDVHGWGLGRNHGRVPALIPRIIDAVAAVHAAAAGEPVRLLGWSLGGYLARETARERPDLVQRVITLGSPVVGGPKYTVTGRHYAANGYDLDEIEAFVAARDAVPLKVPVTAIFSKRDGVVAWRACIDRVNPDVEHVEVRATHFGLGLSPDVLELVARRLAAD